MCIQAPQTPGLASPAYVAHHPEAPNQGTAGLSRRTGAPVVASKHSASEHVYPRPGARRRRAPLARGRIEPAPP